MSSHSTEDLIAFWNNCRLTGDIFYHPEDWAYLSKFADHIDTEPKTFEQFISSRWFGNFNDNRFHLSVIPIPFMGNLRHADIVILLLNPGFGFGDYYAETHSVSYRLRLKQNLIQRFDEIEFPFVCLDPEFCWHPGFGWWEGKLRELIMRIAREKYDSDYRRALKDIANRIAAIEMVPYHSASFSAWLLLNKLPSVRMAKLYDREVLGRAADMDEKRIVVTRRGPDWGLTESENVVVYKGAETRGASLGPRSRGGSAILRRYGINT